jgi:hypothetical protein
VPGENWREPVAICVKNVGGAVVVTTGKVVDDVVAGAAGAPAAVVVGGSVLGAADGSGTVLTRGADA